MKTIITVLLMFAVCSLYAQSEGKKKKIQDDVYFSPQKKSLKEFSELADKDQASRIVFCLNNYRKERSTAICIGLLGASASVASASITDKDTKNAVVYASGGALLISSILFLRAERWIGTKKLVITGNGINIKF